MAQTLYAALGGSNPTSDLYTVDPGTGVMTSVGPIGFAVTGLAFDPTTGLLYGSTSRQSAVHPDALITIDTTTGAGTLVADYNFFTTASDLAFDATGQLWGWDANSSRRVMKIDKATGALTQLLSGLLDLSGGLDFDSAGVLWHIGGSRGLSLTVDTTTGAPTTVATLSSSLLLQAGKFDQSGVFWASQQFTSTISKLVTADPNTGVVVVVSTLSLGKVDAICWSPGVSAPNFSVAVAPTTLTIAQGASDVAALTTSAFSGDTETIALSSSGEPAGVIVSFAPTSIVAGSGSTVTVSVGSAVTPGSYSITLHAVGTLNTHTTTLTLIVTTPALTCADATSLSPLCDIATINNSGRGSTPLASDPLFTLYNLNPLVDTQFKRQLWFKLRNPTAVDKYARFRVAGLSATARHIACAVYLDCPPSESLEPYDLALLDTFLDVLDFRGTVTNSVSAKLGTRVPPHSYVWIEIGADGPSWDGAQISLEWNLLDVEFTDTVDLTAAGTNGRLLPYEFDAEYGVLTSGLSEPVPPPGTPLDYSGFPPFTVSPTFGSSGDTPPFAHIFHGGYHWVAAIRVDDTNTRWPDGDSDVINEHLGIWQLNQDGTIAAFTVIDTVVAGFDHSIAGHDQGESFRIAGIGAQFASDGSELWLAITRTEGTTNIYDTSIPPHDWLPTDIGVYSLSTGWSHIGSLTAESQNRAGSIFGAFSGAIYTFDVSASAAEPGILHVVMSEQGADAGPTPLAPWTSYGGFTNWISALSYASFDSASRTSQRLLFYNADPGPTLYNGPREATSAYCFVRNDHGYPIFLWCVPTSAPGSGYTLKADLYDISGGGMSLLYSFGAADLVGTGITGGVFAGQVITNNLDVDPFDGREVYLFQIAIVGGTGPFTSPRHVVFRLDPTDFATPRYTADDPALSVCFKAFTSTLSQAASMCTFKAYPRSLWACACVDVNTLNRFDYCQGSWSSGPASRDPADRQLSRPQSLAWVDGDSIYYVGQYQNVFGNYSLLRTQIFEQGRICSTSTCVVSSEGLHTWVRVRQDDS